jgi:pimeloyl-ACP methyl ester carboxylesterase
VGPGAERFGPPPLRWSLLEAARASGELLWFTATSLRLRSQAHGDGRPVLVLPGLMGDDSTTWPLRAMLRSVGYAAHGWGLGVNIGPTEQILTGLDSRLRELADQHDCAVSLVGHSLGGLLARDLAVRQPSPVDRVITLASGVGITSIEQTRAGWVYNRFRARHLPEYAFDRWRERQNPDVPLTSIFSRSDGIYQWQACLYPDGPRRENIEVRSSHIGMPVHPAAVYAVLDRLAAPQDPWRRFEAPAHLRHHFPRPPHVPSS